MSTPIFHIGLLRNYQVVNVPGVYLVSVSSTVTIDNLIADEHPRFLVPLRVTTGEGISKLMNILDLVEQVPFGMVRDCFLTGAIFENEGISLDTLPVKGEKVLATFDMKEDKLVCSHIELLPREELEFIDVDKINNFRNKLKTILK